jgi:ribose transport system permease protein
MVGKKIALVVRDNLSWMSLIVLFVLFASINPNFIGTASIKNILYSAAPLLVVSFGVTFVLMIGSIDLSVGAICSCACVIYGMTFPTLGNMSMLAAILFGLIAGVVNGLLFVWLRIPSFIVTLSTMSLWKCLALIIVNGAPKGIPLKLWKSLAWSKIGFGVFPIFFVLALVLLVLCFILQSRTPFGRSIFAVGANERAARMFGIKINSTKLWAFILAGVGSGIAGAFFSIQLKSSLPTIGDSLTLMAVAAVALGGTPLTGGSGSVLRSFLGAILVLTIQNGLNAVAVDAFWQQIVFGALAIFAVYLNSEKGGRSLVVK